MTKGNLIATLKFYEKNLEMLRKVIRISFGILDALL
jgi:hypothetical protein